MFKIANLTERGRYLIQGERGEWHYSGSKKDKYSFWRNAIGTARRVTINLSAYQVQRKVWQEVQTLNLDNLEAMRGE